MDQTTAVEHYQKYHRLKSKLDAYMVILANTGNYIVAIRLYRHLFDSNLSDAKYYIDVLLKR